MQALNQGLMDWNDIKLFLAITENGTLSGAAKALGVNHSTAFRRLNSFEKEVSGRLFERLSHGYELTPMGEEFLGFARKIAASFDDLERHVVGKDVQPKGLVKITAPNNIAYRFLPKYLAGFYKQYPEIQIELLASNQEFNMTNRQADIAIRATDAPPEHLVGRQLRNIKWAVYAGKTYKSGSGMPKRLDDLQEHRLIGAAGMMRNLPGFIWLENNLGQQIHTRCDDLVTMSNFAEAGQGLAFMPDDQQRPELKRLFTFTPGQTSKLWILTHPDLRHVERIKLVMQYLSDAFKAEKAF